jgi:hypothetical protein
MIKVVSEAKAARYKINKLRWRGDIEYFGFKSISPQYSAVWTGTDNTDLYLYDEYKGELVLYKTVTLSDDEIIKTARNSSEELIAVLNENSVAHEVLSDFVISINAEDL